MIYRDVCCLGHTSLLFLPKNTIVINHFTKIIDKADIIKYNYKKQREDKAMSNLTIRFYSNYLRRYTTFQMCIPCDIREDWGQTETRYSENSTKTLFLLHGFSGDAGTGCPNICRTNIILRLLYLREKIHSGLTEYQRDISSANLWVKS